MNGQKTALIVIDMQFGPLWGTFKKEETLSVINKLINKAELEGVPVFYTQHEDLPGGMLERGSQFWKLDSGLTPRTEDTIIYKQSTDSFYHTSLQENLKAIGVTHLVIAGARTEYCVDTTCRVAISLGFNVTLVEDGHTTSDGVIPAEMIIKHHNHNLCTVRNTEQSIEVTPSEKILFHSVGV